MGALRRVAQGQQGGDAQAGHLRECLFQLLRVEHADIGGAKAQVRRLEHHLGGYDGGVDLAVILAVVVLIAGGGKDSGPSSGNRPSVTNNPGSQIVYSAADLPTPSPSPDPTPEASPTPVIESMAIAFLNNNVRDHSLTLTNAGELVIDLDLNVFPNSDELTVTWRSSNEKILTVDDRGIVTVVGASPNITVHATIIAECGGLQDYVTIYVPSYQAAYLTQNLYDPETYEQDNLEWDSIIYATPSPRAG